MVWEKQNVLDLREILDGSNWGLGATDIEVGLGKGHFEVIRNAFGLLRHFLPLVPNVRRQLLVLRAPHLSPILHRVRVRFVLKRRCEWEWWLWQVSELGTCFQLHNHHAPGFCGSLFKINAASYDGLELESWAQIDKQLAISSCTISLFMCTQHNFLNPTLSLFSFFWKKAA